MATCSNGHPVHLGTVFCGACGVDMRTSCINGHLNQPETLFCETCGTELSVVGAPLTPVEGTPLLVTPTTSNSDNLRRFETASPPIPKSVLEVHFSETADPTVTTISSEDSAIADSSGDVAAGQGSNNLDRGHRAPWRRSVLGIGVVTLVIIIAVASVVLIRRHSSAPPTTTIAIPATNTNKATIIKTSVFDTIGVTSPVTPIAAPITLRGQPLLTGVSRSGAILPEVLYVGAEYCPFCAAETWPTIIALSRFGSFTGLRNTTSAAGDIYPNTPSFTFVGSTYSSKYLAFRGIEEYNNVMSSASGYYTPLQKLSTSEEAIFNKYDTSNYIPGTTSADNGSIPFISVGNKFLVSGTSYTPAVLKGLTRSHMEAELSNPANSVTRAIITSANYQTATFCVLTKKNPSSVCDSAGVSAATRVMGLSN
jgi:hypothetical protein